ncbi:NfeD family protein [Carboxylicivirga sp. M1479]|uniref:NfeD family protein n=1 Tax=Carboxylicivirga sp. M1479 TaxID=2594476 RepID=UPI0011775E86|nr:NfeD family protein [Carboxylicivirga sp. M1479]TRX66484.1 NfeD family protein [Carboxylicivirga sp. M1479]
MEILSNVAVIWFLAGAVLLLLELLIPGVFLLFFGVGAWITSLAVYLFEPSLGIQFIIFSITSVISLLFLRNYLLKRLYNMPDPVDDPDDEFAGCIGECILPIKPDEDGRIEFKGTTWNASSETEIEVGSKVKIIRKLGLILFVEPLNN